MATSSTKVWDDQPHQTQLSNYGLWVGVPLAATLMWVIYGFIVFLGFIALVVLTIAMGLMAFRAISSASIGPNQKKEDS